MQWWCSAQGVAWTWQWQAYPGVWLAMAAVAVAYWRLTRSALTERRGGVRIGWVGVALVWLALDWPIGPLAAGYLASAHALQFLLIAMVAAPLMLIGIRAGGWAVARADDGGGRVLRAVTHPLVAATVFNIVTVTTHVSSVVDALMISQAGAFAVDTAWLVSALCFWWPVVVPVPPRPRFHALWQILYIFLGTIFHTIIAIIMLMSQFPLYGVYELAPPMTGLSALDDLHLAGGVMELVGAAIVFGIITWRFFRWASREEAEGAEPPPPVPS